MADIMIGIGSIDRTESAAGYARIYGYVAVDGVEDQLSFSVDVSMGALAATMNNAVKTAAIAAAEGAGATVGVLDKKTLFNAAILL